MSSSSETVLAQVQATAWQDLYRFANRALRAGMAVYQTQPVPLGGPRSLPPGTFLLASRPLEDESSGNVWPDLSSLAADLTVTLQPLSLQDLAGQPLVRLSRPRIGLYGGGGAPFNHAHVFAALGFESDFINDAEIRQGILREFDIILFPGGGFQAMMGQLNPLGSEGARAIAAFVRQGGMYMGSCAGSFNAACVADAFLKVCPSQEALRLINARVWNDGDQWVGLASPGVGLLEAENTDPDHPVMWGMPERFPLTHYNGPMFMPLEEPAVPGASRARGISRFTGRIEAFTPAERFLAPGEADEPFLYDRGVAAGAYTAIVGEVGLGRVALFGSHPEFGTSLLLDDWGIAARMLANAVFWQSSCRPARRDLSDRPAVVSVGAGLPVARPQAAALERLIAGLEELDRKVRGLQEAPVDGARWLQPDYSLSVFGLPPDRIWHEGLRAAREGLRESVAACRGLQEQTDAAGTHPAVAAARRALDALLWYRRDEAWEQDIGFQGLFELVRLVGRQLDGALTNLSKSVPDPVGHPYQHFDVNPYHLAVGSYLSAMGNVGGIKLLLLRTEAELADARTL